MNNQHKMELSMLYKNSNINYIHDETPHVENDTKNDYKQSKSQETKQAWPKLHIHVHPPTHIRKHTHTPMSPN